MKGLLAIPTTFTDWEHFETYCRNVGRLKRQLPWIVGQLMVRGESAFGERVYQIADIFGYEVESVRNFASVCRTITVDEYTDALDWSSWQALSAVKDAKSRGELVTRALGGLSRDDIRHEVKMLTNGAEIDASAVTPAATPLVEALLLVGRILSRESKGDDVLTVLEPALDRLIVHAMERLATVQRMLVIRAE